MQVAGRVWSASCTLITFYVLAHRLDAESFGRFTRYLAVFAWLDSLATLGTGQVAVQLTVNDPDALHAVIAAGRRIRVLAGLLGVTLVGGWAFLHGESGALWILIASFYPVTHALELSSVVFRNQISWRVPVIMRALAAGMSLGFVLALLAFGVREPALYLLGVAAGSTLANFLLFRESSRRLPPRVGVVAPARGVFRASLPLGLSALCAQLYFYIDNLFVSAMVGDGPLGHYNVAVRFMSLLIMIAQYVSLSALPWFVRSHARGELGLALEKLGARTFALAGLAVGVLWPWTFELLERFRPGIGDASWSLRWLLAATGAIYAGSLFVTAVVATGSNRWMLAISALGLAVNVAANFWAVPRYGITGAGLTTFITEATVTVVAACALSRIGVRFGGGRLWRWLGGPAAFGAGLALSSALRSLVA